MSKKFEKVLSEQELAGIFEVMGYAGGHGTFLDIANEVQQAVIAKLAEQEPVATVSQETFSNDGTSDIITSNLPIGTPLYAHPCVSPTSDKTAYVSENGGGDTQAAHSPTKGMNLAERIAHVGGRENDNGYVEFGSVMAVHALINHVIRDLGSALPKVKAEHTPVTDKMIVPEGFQLVPDEPTGEMHLAARDWSVKLYGKAIGLDASHGCYKAMLSAVPKYTEDK